MGGVIIGIIAVVAGLALIAIGLSADLSCGLIRALGGQCYALFGNLAVEEGFRILPPLLLGFGALFIIVGGITAARAARE
jgi:hypothetical protein